MSGLESVKEIHHPVSEPTRVFSPLERAAVDGADMSAGPSLPRDRLSEALAAFDEEALPPVPDAPEIIDTLMRNAILLVENREHALAQNLLRNVLMRSPNHPEGLHWLGQCLDATGRPIEAEKCYRALLRLQPTVANIARLADTLYLLGRDRDATELYHEALSHASDVGPWLFDILKNLGNIHVRAGDFEAAEEFYNKAHTLNPSSDTLMVNYGTLEIQRENFARAVERFRDAVALNPDNDRGWVGLAMVHRQMGDLELSRANIERALDINPRNKTALHLLVEWNALDREFGASVRRLKDYLALEGEDAEMSFLLAKILAHLNRLPEAMIEIERSLALDPLLEGGDRLYEVVREELRRRMETA